MAQLLFSVTIRDCELQTFRAGGKGGQKQNKTESGVRIIHRPSGAVGESREERSQMQNKRNAFRRMAETEKFRKWLKIRIAQQLGEKSVEEIVDEMMRPQNIRIERRNQIGQWENWEDSGLTPGKLCSKHGTEWPFCASLH